MSHHPKEVVDVNGLIRGRERLEGASAVPPGGGLDWWRHDGVRARPLAGEVQPRVVGDLPAVIATLRVVAAAVEVRPDPRLKRRQVPLTRLGSLFGVMDERDGIAAVAAVQVGVGDGHVATLLFNGPAWNRPDGG